MYRPSESVSGENSRFKNSEVSFSTSALSHSDSFTLTILMYCLMSSGSFPSSSLGSRSSSPTPSLGY